MGEHVTAPPGRKVLVIGPDDFGGRVAVGGVAADFLPPDTVDLPPAARLAEYAAIALPDRDPLPNQQWFNRLLTAHRQARKVPPPSPAALAPWPPVFIVTPRESPPDVRLASTTALDTLLTTDWTGLPLDAFTASNSKLVADPNLVAELTRPREPDQAERNVLFLQRVGRRLTSWLWPDPDTQAEKAAVMAAGSADPLTLIQSARSRAISRLRRAVMEAAADETPAPVVSVVGWAEEVLSVYGLLHGWRRAGVNNQWSGFIVVGPNGTAPDPTAPVFAALAPGLLVAILVEAWGWVLGVLGRPHAAELAQGEAPLCRVMKDEQSGVVRVSFTPREQSALRDNPPPEWHEFREYLVASEYASRTEPPGTVTLTFPLAEPPPSPPR